MKLPDPSFAYIVELGPVLGIGFIGFRVMLTLWLGGKAVRAARRCADITPFVLFGYVGIVLLQNQITGHGTINGFAWFFVGLCLAAARIAGGPGTGPSTRHRTTPAPNKDNPGYFTCPDVWREGYRSNDIGDQ